jgi:hypothetical protein
MAAKIASGILALCLLALTSTDAQAGIFRRGCHRRCPSPCGPSTARAPVSSSAAEDLQAQINELDRRVDRLDGGAPQLP